MESVGEVNSKVAPRLGDEVEITLANETNGKIVQGGKKMLAMWLADEASILMKRDITDIVEAVLDMPMLLDNF